MMEPIPVQFTERANVDRHQEPVRFGVPLQQAQLGDTARLRLIGQDGTPVPADFSPLLYWPDGSLRWVSVDTLVSLSSTLTTTMHLVQMPQSHHISRDWRVTEDKRFLMLQIGSSTLKIDRSSLAWWLTDEKEAQYQHVSVVLEDLNGMPCSARVEDWHIVHCGTVTTTLEATGWWHDGTGAPLARFRCTLIAFTTGQVAVDTCIHNPKRASHPGGLWDLGDPGSVRFGALGIHVNQPGNSEVRLALTSDGPAQSLDVTAPVHLHQESSGGDQWQSRNHVGASGRILPRYKGYRLTKGGHDLDQGDRASPIIEVCSSSGERISASMPHFWQKFPSALQADRDGLTVWLFPKDKPEPYELQGGERKTQRVVLAYAQPLGSLGWTHAPLLPVVPVEHYDKTNAFPWFRAAAPHTPLDDLIREGLDGPANFFQKREVIDEYGWRNFGDIFADHETLYQKKGEAPYVSHYNNQYDAIYGFARQFARSGDPRWFDLMNDLARHVADIDIYHTDEDRSEYNHGLFWHTDHYLDAHTATHRTYTRHNDTSSIPGQLGGGPAWEHCYTTGLLYHYLMTGCHASREAVLELAGWMKTTHQGQGGLLEQMLALKKKEWPKLREKLRGGKPSPHQFPLTRSTGNYLNTLLDASQLEQRSHYLELAGRLIRQTIHPADDIDQRQLLVKETGWSYLVLLSSVVRYLELKDETKERDHNWRYARDCFLHYTRWMRDKEKPFLHDHREREVANHTWVAQDIRKVMLMYQARVLFPFETHLYQEKAEQLLEHIYHLLLTSKERHFARIQILLLQNYGPHQVQPELQITEPYQPARGYATPTLGWGMLGGRILQRLARGLARFRPAAEKAWLDARLDRS